MTMQSEGHGLACGATGFTTPSRQGTPIRGIATNRSLLDGHSCDRSRFFHGLLRAVVVSLLTVSACSAGSSQEPPQPRPLDEILSEYWPPPSEEDLRVLAAANLLDDPPQDVEFERYIHPDEFAAVLVPCYTEQGVLAHALPDGGIGFEEVPPAQALSQREAIYRCDVRFPVHPFFQQRLTDEQLRRIYDYLAGELTACLEAEGYVTPPPPSVEAFVESYYDPQAITWSPYPIGDPRLDQGTEWYRLNVVCPQGPSIEDLYGP